MPTAPNTLSRKDVIAAGADTWGFDAIPGEKKNILYPAHQILINYAGIYILENMDTRELAADGAYEFMFVLGPARGYRRGTDGDQPDRDSLKRTTWGTRR